MASSDATQRVVLAGLSCGIGLAAPVVMYAATLRFPSRSLKAIMRNHTPDCKRRCRIETRKPLATGLKLK